MRCHIVFNGSPQVKRKRLLELFETHSPQMNAAQKDIKISEQMINQNKLLENIRKSYEESIEKTGVFSLTEDPRSILMWSHYSSNHQGVCLQFEVARDVHIFTMPLIVDYSKSYPTINWTEHTNAQLASKQLGKVLTCKHEGWRYEREHRIVIPNAAGGYLSFSTSALTGIILGCQMTIEGEAEFRKLLNERSAKGLPDIILYRAKQRSRRFELCLSKENA